MCCGLKNCQERNIRIGRMCEAGASPMEIASTLSMSIEALRMVFRQQEADKAEVRKSKELLEKLRRANDLDKKWEVADVLDALLLMARTRAALRVWFEEGKIEQINLREFMDLVISEKRHSKTGYLIAPLLDVRCAGAKGFWWTVRRLTESDLGESCNQEWGKRLGQLRQASRIVGDRRLSWSQPCEIPLWLPRPERTNVSPHLETGNQ